MQKICNIEAVDLFCGVGGLTHGLSKEGILVKAGVDVDDACQYPFEVNNGAKFIKADVASLDGKVLSSLYSKGATKLLAGCAPCQPFSAYTNGRDTRTDHKWGLLYEFDRLVKQISPELVTMENVPQVTKHEVFKDFLKSLESENYHVSYGVVYCPDYGIPQHRRRLVLLASKLGPIQMIPATHSPSKYKTVRKTIGKLPPIEAGEAHPNDSLHRASRMNELNMHRIRQSKPGGSWRDWDNRLIAECHRKESGKSYPGVYGRMAWDEPSPTITTLAYGFGNGRFGHPEQDRALTLREAALLQTFPKNYVFTRPNEEPKMRDIGRLIGNAVPVDLGRVVAKSLLKHLAQV